MAIRLFENRLLFLCTVLLVANAGFANETTIWQTVTLADQKIGYRKIHRQSSETHITTTESLSIRLHQPGADIKTTETKIEYVETVEGLPVSLSKSLTSPNANHEILAVVKEGFLHVRLNGTHERSIEIPKSFLLPEAVRRKLSALPGDHRELSFYEWNFTTLKFDEIQLTASRVQRNASSERSDSNAVRWKLVRTRTDHQRRIETVIHADENFLPFAEYSTLSGKSLSIARCDKSCALREFTPTTHVYQNLIRSPYRITEAALRGKIRYRLQGEHTLQPPTTGEQIVRPFAQGVEIDVCAHCTATAPPPTEAELQAALATSYWLPADNPVFRRLAEELGSGRDQSPEAKMARFTRFVSGHMSDYPDYSGYATALEAYHSRQGDCTEHALLLATLGRAAGIPTRIVIGIVYDNERFMGRRFVFAPHAWVQAWVGDHWASYDSGMGKFSAGHIALGLGYGEPAANIGVNEQLHRLEIVTAAQLR